MKKIILGFICLFNFGFASAETINFDDLAGNFDPVPNGYKGFKLNISNLTGVVNINPYLVSGVDYTGIKDNALFNAFGYIAPNTTVISATGATKFDFLSGFWSAGLTGNTDIQFEGYVNNHLVHTSSIYNLNGSSVTPILLNWYGIDSLSILSSPSIWIADNLDVNLYTSPVPVPAAVWLFGSAILGFMGLRRKYI